MTYEQFYCWFRGVPAMVDKVPCAEQWAIICKVAEEVNILKPKVVEPTGSPYPPMPLAPVILKPSIYHPTNPFQIPPCTL